MLVYLCSLAGPFSGRSFVPSGLCVSEYASMHPFGVLSMVVAL